LHNEWGERPLVAQMLQLTEGQLANSVEDILDNAGPVPSLPIPD